MSKKKAYCPRKANEAAWLQERYEPEVLLAPEPYKHQPKTIKKSDSLPTSIIYCNFAEIFGCQRQPIRNINKKKKKQDKPAMDKNTIIGFVLIALVLIGFSWYNQPTEEEIKAQQEQVAKQEAKAKEAQQKAKAENNIS